MKPTIEHLYDLSGFEYRAIFDGMVFPWEALSVIEQYILSHTESAASDAASDVSAAAHIGPNVVIGKNVTIEHGVVIKGPAIIGDNVTLRANAYIRENVIIGAGSVIGNSCEVKNSIVMNGAQIPHFNYVGDSVVGNRAHLSGGAALSNTTMFGKDVVIRDNEGAEYATHLLKCGAFLGDDAQLGANVVVAPGVVIGKRSIVYPLLFIRDMIPEDIIVKLRQDQEQVPMQKT